MNTQNKNAIITGANRGIGLALTHKLLHEGYNVIGTSRSGKIDGLEDENLSVIQLDVTDKGSVTKAIEQISKVTKKIDLLVNNAGVAPDIFAAEPEVDSFDSTFAANVNGTVFFTEPLLPFMSEGAQIVFISSNMGLTKNLAPNGPAYRMTKAAINTYAIMLAQRLAERNIRVTPMHPGWVQTRLGGSKAPFTPEQAADGLFNGIKENTESGKFWNIEIGALEEY